jgi:hypothetical protein
LTATTNTEIKNRIQRRHQAPAPPWSSSTGSSGHHAPDSVVAFSGMRIHALLEVLKLPIDDRGRRRAAARAEWFAARTQPLDTGDILAELPR